MKTIVIALALSGVCTTTFADGKTAKVFAPGADGPLAFAAGEIKSALRSAGWDITPDGPAVFNVILEAPRGRRQDCGKTGILQDRHLLSGFRRHENESLDSRRRRASASCTAAWTWPNKFRMHGPFSIKPKTELPLLGVRAMKFNPPLKGNVYMSDEDLKNSAWFYDLEYWDRFMRTMAYNRYNTLTFWSSHPYDQMVRLRKYPEATTLSQDRLDKNIVFFHKLFQMAKNIWARYVLS